MAHPKVGTTPIGTLAQERTRLLLSLILTSWWGSRILCMIGALSLARVDCFCFRKWQRGRLGLVYCDSYTRSPCYFQATTLDPQLSRQGVSPIPSHSQ